MYDFYNGLINFLGIRCLRIM